MSVHKAEINASATSQVCEDMSVISLSDVSSLPSSEPESPPYHKHTFVNGTKHFEHYANLPLEDPESLAMRPCCNGQHIRLFNSGHSCGRWSGHVVLKPNSYNPRDLMNMTVFRYAYPDDPILSITQRQARKSLNAWTNSPLLGDAGSLEARFRKCLVHLDNYFFFGGLCPWVSIRWIDQGGPYGWCGPDTRRGFPWHKINIVKCVGTEPSLDNDAEDNLEREKLMFGTLIHECCHAYLNIFSCHRRGCALDFANTVGCTGHGVIWWELTHAIQDHVRSWGSWFADVSVEFLPYEGGRAVKREAKRLLVVQQRIQQIQENPSCATWKYKGKRVEDARNLFVSVEDGYVIKPDLKVAINMRIESKKSRRGREFDKEVVME